MVGMSGILWSTVTRLPGTGTPSAQQAIDNLHRHYTGKTTPVTYLRSMGGYLIDTVKKAVMLVFNILALVFSPLSFEGKYMKSRAIIVLDNFLALGISVVGILAPPLAYRMDDAVAKAMYHLDGHRKVKLP